jgi:hypothetical protein
LARLEALLMGMPDDRELRLLLEQLDPGARGTFTWLDPRNAALALLSETAAVPVQVLLELRGRSQLGVLVTSGESMSRGAPFSRAMLKEVLAQLQTLVPGCELHYRSDRDGPVEQAPAWR